MCVFASPQMCLHITKKEGGLTLTRPGLLPSEYEYMRTLNSTLSDYPRPAFKLPKRFGKTVAQWISPLLYLPLSFS